jgi:K+-sensing histidine kinase KdpD
MMPGGVGVGLALVAKFAELHEGRAWVQERAGGGASFRVLLAFEPRTGVIVLEDDDQDTATGSSPEESQA